MNRQISRKQSSFISHDKENFEDTKNVVWEDQVDNVVDEHIPFAEDNIHSQDQPLAKTVSSPTRIQSNAVVNSDLTTPYYVDFEQTPTGLIYLINFKPTTYLLQVVPEPQSEREIIHTTDENGAVHLHLKLSNRLTILRQENIKSFALVDLILVVQGIDLSKYAQDGEVIEVEGTLTDMIVVLEFVCESSDPVAFPDSTTTRVLCAPLNCKQFGIHGKIGLRINRHKMLMMLAEYIIQCSLIQEQEVAVDEAVHVNAEEEKEEEEDAKDKTFKLISDYSMSRLTTENTINDFEDATAEDLIQAAISATRPSAFWYRLVEVRDGQELRS